LPRTFARRIFRDGFHMPNPGTNASAGVGRQAPWRATFCNPSRPGQAAIAASFTRCELISPLHWLLRVRGATILIRDLDATTRMLVNGERLLACRQCRGSWCIRYSLATPKTFT
jgi:hypothetical protein